MKDGYTEFCKWCAPCFNSDKLLVLKDTHVCPNIKLKKCSFVAAWPIFSELDDHEVDCMSSRLKEMALQG